MGLDPQHTGVHMDMLTVRKIALNDVIDSQLRADSQAGVTGVTELRPKTKQTDKYDRRVVVTYPIDLPGSEIKRVVLEFDWLGAVLPESSCELLFRSFNLNQAIERQMGNRAPKYVPRVLEASKTYRTRYFKPTGYGKRKEPLSGVSPMVYPIEDVRSFGWALRSVNIEYQQVAKSASEIDKAA